MNVGPRHGEAPRTELSWPFVICLSVVVALALTVTCDPLFVLLSLGALLLVAGAMFAIQVVRTLHARTRAASLAVQCAAATGICSLTILLVHDRGVRLEASIALSAICSGATLMLCAMIYRILLYSRLTWRRSLDECLRCGYKIWRLPTFVCPECGCPEVRSRRRLQGVVTARRMSKLSGRRALAARRATRFKLGRRRARSPGRG